MYLRDNPFHQSLAELALTSNN